MLYRHKKTGNAYVKLMDGIIDATNKNQVPGTFVYLVLYRRADGTPNVYAREATEFAEKFEEYKL